MATESTTYDSALAVSSSQCVTADLPLATSASWNRVPDVRKGAREGKASRPYVFQDSPIVPLVPGPTRIVLSSAPLAWNGFLLEKHLASPGQRGALSSDRHVIAMMWRGTVRFEYRTAGQSWTSITNRAHSLVIMPATLLPEARLQTPAEIVFCALDESFTREAADGLVGLRKVNPVFHPDVSDHAIGRVLALLVDEIEANGESGKLYVDCLTHALTVRYLLLACSDAALLPLAHSALPKHILNRVLAKVEASLQSDLSLESLAAETGYSRAHFLRMFRAATGLTPHQYVLELRLRQAQELLRRKSVALIDIAALCGFSSQSHMTTVFRKRLAITPAEYRRSL
jgi:AraC family transcriptional regulator